MLRFAMTRPVPVVLLAGFLALTIGTVTAQEQFIRSDFNQDGKLDVADPVRILGYLFVHGSAQPGCLDAGDSNDDGRLDISDSLFALGYLFSGGPAPPAPFPFCGCDLTEDALSCDEGEICRVPNLSEVAGHCGGVPVTAYPNSLQPGDDLHKVTLADPLAICNDGSPGVYYVRAAAPDSPHANRWVIYLQGGGGCGSFELCLARWCGRQSAAYNESKMSSIYTPESIGGTGMFLRGEHEVEGQLIENAFGDFNQVFVYYCSSDSWAGRKSDVVLTSSEDPRARYSLNFRGHDIVRASIAQLMTGVTSDDEEVTMAPLAEAESVIISGFSAGSGGVATNGDWIASQLEPNGTTVRLVRDASFWPRPETHPDPDEAARLAELIEEQWTEAWLRRQKGLFDAFVDESARAALEGTDDEWRLADKAYISHNHITTSTFVRKDLGDRGTRQTFADWGVSTEDFAHMMRTTLMEVPLIAEQAVEADAIEKAWGSFGPGCGDHVGLMTNSSFFLRLVDDENGTPRTYHDTLLRWLQGPAVTVVDDPDNPSTVCGAEVPEEE